MKLQSGVIKYLVIGQVCVPFFINMVVNVTLGVLTFHGSEKVTTWTTDNGAVVDSVGTCFFLPFITCLIATPIVRRHVAHSVVDKIPLAELPAWMRLLIRPLLPRAAIVGAFCLILLAGPVCAVYWLFAGESIGTVWFIAIKSIFACVLGMFVTPFIALLALSEVPRQ